MDFPKPPENLSFDEVRLYFIRIQPGEEKHGLVPAYHFRILLEGGINAGHINLRVGDTDHVRLYSGHVGFEVRERCRGHGYAYQACRALAPFIRNFYDDVTITCDPDNLPSKRTIERLGATFINELTVPLHDPHYLRGSRSKLRYRWTP
jgi:tagatose 1,6-diphosphate aldolase